MGLPARGVQLVLDYAVVDGRFRKQQTLHAPGVARVDFRREMVKDANGGNALLVDEWHAADEGFVAARNRFCAGKDRIDVAAFPERHVDSVRRMLESRGLAASTELEQAYLQYAMSGGTIGIVVHYDPPIGAPLYNTVDLGSWLPRVSGTVSRNGATLALTMHATPVRPLPDDDASTYESLQREREAGAPAPLAPVPGAAATAGSIAAVPAAGRQDAHAAEIAAATPSVAAATAGASATDSAASRVDKYGNLARYVGSDLTVYMRGRDAVRVQVVRVAEAGAILVRRRFAGGSFEFTLDRGRFEYAER